MNNKLIVLKIVLRDIKCALSGVFGKLLIVFLFWWVLTSYFLLSGSSHDTVHWVFTVMVTFIMAFLFTFLVVIVWFVLVDDWWCDVLDRAKSAGEEQKNVGGGNC